LNLNPDLAAVNSWGGEENDPPIYGKVYVAVKPITGTLISTNRKTEITDSVKQYNVQSIDIVMVDPTYLYVVPAITIRYNPNETELTGGGIGALVASKIIAYESSNLNLFDKKFRFSRFLDYISDADPSIVAATSTINIQRKFAPSVVLKDDYVLTYNQELRRLGDKKLTDVLYGFISSSSFTYKEDVSFFDDDGFGTLRAYYLDGFARNYINSTIGTIDYVTGIIYINSFLPSAISGDIKINARPLYEDVIPIRNQILLITDATIRVINDNSDKLESTISSVNTIGSTTSLSAVTSASVSLATY
jgi:hypothetical protein